MPLPVAAETMSLSAAGPPSTTALAPSSFQPLPSAFAAVVTTTDFVAAPAFVVGQRQHQFAAGDGGQQASFCAALPASRIRPPQTPRWGVGLEHQAAAEAFHHQHAVDGVAVQPAEILGEGQGEQAEVGELLPVARLKPSADFASARRASKA
jgi:hypothetical protein